MNKIIPLLIGIFLSAGCQKENVYQVNNVTAHSMNAAKTKEKSDEQYIAVLYADLFNEPASVANINSITQVFESIGDKDLVHELLVSSYMNTNGVQVPTNAQMRADIPTFVRNTYRKFLVRDPSVAELTYFTTYIQNNSNVTPELVYVAFTTSNEYKFY